MSPSLIEERKVRLQRNRAATYDMQVTSMGLAGSSRLVAASLSFLMTDGRVGRIWHPTHRATFQRGGQQDAALYQQLSSLALNRRSAVQCSAIEFLVGQIRMVMMLFHTIMTNTIMILLVGLEPCGPLMSATPSTERLPRSF